MAHGFGVNSDSPEVVAWNLSRRCRTGEALPVVEQALLERSASVIREAGLPLTTDNGTQFASTWLPEALATAP